MTIATPVSVALLASHNVALRYGFASPDVPDLIPAGIDLTPAAIVVLRKELARIEAILGKRFEDML